MSCTGAECLCGCCEQDGEQAPRPIFNRPGLPRIAYRAGTYGDFRAAMIRAAARDPALLRWSARDDDDLGMALLDCWAYVADVLTFYGERAANESFLRTARLRDSVQRLTALLGYRLAPGVAATARLAFTIEAGRELVVPAGLRVTNLPGPGEPPVTFETSAPLAAAAGLNAMPMRGARTKPERWMPAEGRGGAPVHPADAGAVRAALRPGSEVVLWSERAVAAEEKRIGALSDDGPLLRLRFEPAAQSAAFGGETPVLTRFARKLRLFGHDAPPTWMRQFATKAGDVRFEQVSEGDAAYDLRAPAKPLLRLDRVVDDLRPGTTLLIVAPGFVARRVVSAVGTVAASAGPVSAAVTQVAFAAPLWSEQGRPSVRAVVAYELRPPDFRLWDDELPSLVTGSKVFVPRPDDPSPLRAGREVIFEDGGGEPVVTRIAAVGTAESFDGAGEDLLALDLVAPLARPLAAASAVLRGNVAEATHGETVAHERLGSGDAAVAFQRLALARSPLTHVPRAGEPHGAAPEIEVRVGGTPWERAETLLGRSPADRAYVVEVSDDGGASVRFGNGEQGSRVATGAEITARYRTGSGRAGLVAARRLSAALDRPPGLKSVTNPLPASGAADPESLDRARENAPGSVRTFERIVSLRDFEDQALASALVAKARALTVPGTAGPGVRLVVAGEHGEFLDDAALASLRADLDARRDPNRRLDVAGYHRVALEIGAVLVAAEPRRPAGELQAAARAALLGALSFDRRAFGQALHASDVLAVLHAVHGVAGVDLEAFNTRASADRPIPRPAVAAHIVIAGDELVTLDPDDLRIDVR